MSLKDKLKALYFIASLALAMGAGTGADGGDAALCFAAILAVNFVIAALLTRSIKYDKKIDNKINKENGDSSKIISNS